MAKYVCLSFDDGPNFPGDRTMENMLDLLEANNVIASFFVIGNKITDENKAVIKRAFDMGCDIQNHSWTHPNMAEMNETQIREEYDKTDAAIIDITGVKPTFFRPPYICTSKLMFDTIEVPFICGQGCEDWIPDVSAERRVQIMKENTKDGIIYLLHVNEGNVNTYDAVKEMIPWLKAEGYTFVTVDQMFKIKGVTNGRNGENWSYVN